jgi:hypothetical protein
MKISKVEHRLRLGTMPAAQLACEGAEVNLFFFWLSKLDCHDQK